MTQYIVLDDPPANRRRGCLGEKEQHLTEAAVMIAFAQFLLKEGATRVEIHPDGEHGKKYPIRNTLEAEGFKLVAPHGRTNYAGRYERGGQSLNVTLKPGLGDVESEFDGQYVVAECKGGIVNTRHSGQLSKQRQRLREAIGQLMARPRGPERQIAVVPATPETVKVARRMLSRAMDAGLEIALVNEEGNVTFLRKET